MATRLKALSRMSRVETDLFVTANKHRQKGVWIWDVLDARIREAAVVEDVVSALHGAAQPSSGIPIPVDSGASQGVDVALLRQHDAVHAERKVSAVTQRVQKNAPRCGWQAASNALAVSQAAQSPQASCPTNEADNRLPVNGAVALSETPSAPPSPSREELAQCIAAMLGPEAVFAEEAADVQMGNHLSPAAVLDGHQPVVTAAQSAVTTAMSSSRALPNQAKRLRGSFDHGVQGIRRCVPRLPGMQPRSGSTKWVPATGTPAAVSDTSDKQQCRHVRRTKPASAGCHWVCSDCGEQLGYEGWRLEFSALGRIHAPGVPAELAAQNLTAMHRQPQFHWDVAYDEGCNDYFMLHGN